MAKALLTGNSGVHKYFQAGYGYYCNGRKLNKYAIYTYTHGPVTGSGRD